MDRSKKNNLPVSVRIAFVAFVTLGVIIIGVLWMSRNDWKEKGDALAAEVSRYEEIIESKQEQLDAPMDDEYLKDLARESGYVMPGEQFYPIEYED
ncbi:MAG: septum formation initiator family protein [Oscillospiraceae bacterium]|nr:septum formation initiator family protein [Clostridia bacterium]MBQ9857933.1 septum formation initiator family protein [Oscillospiraceae bacterium]